ncbi:hypothetical protein JCM5350_000957 [Sporobolomyces pararoseus]
MSDSASDAKQTLATAFKNYEKVYSIVSDRHKRVLEANKILADEFGIEVEDEEEKSARKKRTVDSISNKDDKVLTGSSNSKSKSKSIALNDPNRPKGPTQANVRYKRSVKDDVKKKNPNLSLKEIDKMCDKMWAELKDEEKAVWKKEYAKDKALHVKELAAYAKKKEHELVKENSTIATTEGPGKKVGSVYKGKLNGGNSNSEEKQVGKSKVLAKVTEEDSEIDELEEEQVVEEEKSHGKGKGKKRGGEGGNQQSFKKRKMILFDSEDEEESE